MTLPHPRPVRIFTYGRDPHLLLYRSWVLESAGFEVVRTTRAELISEEENFDLYIFCHTLSHGEIQIALKLVEKRSPQSKVLCLSKVTGAEEVKVELSFLHAFASPQLLLGTIFKVLKSELDRQFAPQVSFEQN